jgi:hypothetical protein
VKYLNNYFDKLKENRGATALLLTILILGSIMYISITSSTIVQKGVTMSWVQVHSAKAYFAAEAGSERALYAIREEDFDIEALYNGGAGPCPDPTNFIEFDCATYAGPPTPSSPCCNLVSPPPPTEQVLTNQSTYHVDYDLSDATYDYVLNSYGSYGQTRRVVELKF